MERGEVPAHIVRVISNVAEAPGLARAQDLRLPALCIPHQSRVEPRGARGQGAGRAARRARRLDLPGRLHAAAVGDLRGAVLRTGSSTSIPACCPAFPGRDPQRQALEHGVRVSGCTVHLVDEGLDSGPIVVQRVVPVHDQDTPESLGARILDEEHWPTRRPSASCSSTPGRCVAGGSCSPGRPKSSDSLG